MFSEAKQVKPVAPPAKENATPFFAQKKADSFFTRAADKSFFHSQNIQCKVNSTNAGRTTDRSEHIKAAAQYSKSGPSISLPHAEQIQKSFGSEYPVSEVKAYVGGQAAEACQAMGASAFAFGDSVAFKSFPNVHTAAHETAHVIQQKKGVSLESGLGKVGDIYEQQADAIASRVVSGQSATDLLSSSPGIGVSSQTAVQLEPEGATAPATPVTNTPSPTIDPPASTGPKTAPLTLSAVYEDVAGESKNKGKRATAGEALWLDPLTMYSNYPNVKRNMKSVGLVGRGQQTVDTFQAPVSEEDHPTGQGSISSELKYAASRNKSFEVKVTAGVPKKDKGKAEATARKIVEEQMNDFGDVDEITGIAKAKLKETYPDADLSVTVKDDKVMDAGQSTFFYKLNGAAGILMEVLVVPIGEKSTEVTSTQTNEKGTAEDVRKKEATTTETLDITYNKNVVKTLDDYVSKLTTIHNEVASDLAEKIVKEDKAHYTDKDEISRVAKNVTDYTKESKHTVESGERDKENWAAKAKKGVKIAKKVTSIPFIDKIPGVGWITRKVKGWQLDLAEEVLDLFAETGKATYTDTKLDESAKRTDDITDKTERDRKVDLVEHSKEETKRTLREDYKSTTKDEWEQHKKEIEDTREVYKSRYAKNEKETETTQHTKANQSTQVTFKVSDTWKYTKPVVKASVVNGEAKVSNAPFPPPQAKEQVVTPAPKT